MMLQLDPTIPMMTPKGSGYALFVVDYSQEHHLMWVVALDAGGEIWMFENPDVRVQSNYTLGRRPDRAFGLRSTPASASAPGAPAPTPVAVGGNGVAALGAVLPSAAHSAAS